MLPRDHLPVVQPDHVVDKVRFPDMTDLMARLHFSTSDGRIWLDDQRMLLVHAKALGSLRREMIEALGVEVARGFLTRMGYHAGACDAQMARKVRPATTLKDMFVVGPQMHCLEGIGLSEAVRLEFDVERGTHYGEFIWTSPVEDEEHARHFVDRHRADVLDADRLRVGLFHGVHGPAGAVPRGRVPVDGPAGLPHRGQDG